MTTTTKKKKKAAPAATKKKKATATAKKTMAASDKKPRIYAMSFASVYPLYVQKAEKKGRTKQEVDEVIGWLTGYRGAELQRVLDEKISFEQFFAEAQLHKNAGLITGVVCGVRIEDLEDPLMKKIRWLDKLVEELAQGRALERILRAG